VPEPYYLHLSKRQYMERWQEFEGFCQVVELEVIERPMRVALLRFLHGLLVVERTSQVGASPLMRSRRRTDRRIGFYLRVLLTAFGMARE